MSLIVENESALPITVSEKDMIAAGTEEGALPSLDACAVVQAKQESFCRGLDWAGAGEDTERVVTSSREDGAIVVVIHKIPRFAACYPGELSDQWKDLNPITRITTLTFREGDLDYLVEDTEKGGEIGEWVRTRPWCGQTAFTFPIIPEASSRIPHTQ